MELTDYLEEALAGLEALDRGRRGGLRRSSAAGEKPKRREPGREEGSREPPRSGPPPWSSGEPRGEGLEEPAPRSGPLPWRREEPGGPAEGPEDLTGQERTRQPGKEAGGEGTRESWPLSLPGPADWTGVPDAAGAPAVESGMGPGETALRYGMELDWAERADRVFRRDSRRYDGGFYLY